jgi:hypothetical protein
MGFLDAKSVRTAPPSSHRDDEEALNLEVDWTREEELKAKRK